MLGVMQGRLTKKNSGLYQSHPSYWWEEEFQVANLLKLDCIEFIVDKQSALTNPMLNEEGLKTIKNAIKETNIKVESICADIFMDEPLNEQKGPIVRARVQFLRKLIDAASSLNTKTIVLPFVDQTSLVGKDIGNLVKNIAEEAKIAKERGIKIALETDLPPQDFRILLNKFENGTMYVNYDIGNSAALGYKFSEEMEEYGDLVVDIHIKDRNYKGGSVMLGTGDAELNKTISFFKKTMPNVPLIMQAYRTDNAIESFVPQLQLVKEILNKG